MNMLSGRNPIASVVDIVVIVMLKKMKFGYVNMI